MDTYDKILIGTLILLMIILTGLILWLGYIAMGVYVWTIPVGIIAWCTLSFLLGWIVEWIALR